MVKNKGETVHLIAIRNGEWGAKAVEMMPEDSQKVIYLDVTKSTNSPLRIYYYQ